MENPEQKPDFATSRVKKVLNREKKALSHELEKTKEHHFSFEKRPALLPEVTPPQPQSKQQADQCKISGKNLPKAYYNGGNRTLSQSKLSFGAD